MHIFEKLKIWKFGINYDKILNLFVDLPIILCLYNFCIASALALMYNGPYTEQVYTSRLISSVLQLAEPQCLSLIYMRKTPIIVTLQNSLGYNLTVFQDEYTLTSDPDWSRVLIDLPVVTDEGCMIFISSQSNSGYLQYSIVIDDIKVTPGLCLEQELTGILINMINDLICSCNRSIQFCNILLISILLIVYRELNEWTL